MELREKYLARVMNDPVLFGITEAKFIHSPQVFTARGVRLRCQYLCSQTRQSVTSPPYSPSAAETREVLDEYKFGVLLRREVHFGAEERSRVWTDFAGRVLGLEEECARRGYSRAFAVAIGNCIYLHQDDHFRPCDYPVKGRPTLEAVGIELRDTLEMVNWDQYLVRDSGDPFQMFGLLMLD